MPDPTAVAELIRLRNRITALEANGSELLARAERAETQMAAIRTLITEDYGADYDDEDVPAAVERLMCHLSEHEANVQRILQRKNVALEQAQAAIERVREVRDQWALATTSPDGSPNSRLRTQLYADVVAWLDAALNAPHGPADAPSPVSAATEAHGETTEAQEG